MIGVTLGTFLMGRGLRRAEAVSRRFARLLLLVLPTTLLAGPLGETVGVGILAGYVATLPLIAAVVVMGRWLWTYHPDSAPAIETAA